MQYTTAQLPGYQSPAPLQEQVTSTRNIERGDGGGWVSARTTWEARKLYLEERRIKDGGWLKKQKRDGARAQRGRRRFLARRPGLVHPSSPALLSPLCTSIMENSKPGISQTVRGRLGRSSNPSQSMHMASGIDEVPTLQAQARCGEHATGTVQSLRSCHSSSRLSRDNVGDCVTVLSSDRWPNPNDLSRETRTQNQ